MCLRSDIPMDGVGPSDLQIQTLVERVEDGRRERGILALESDNGGRYDQFLYLQKAGKCSRTYQRDCTWVGANDELQYTDEVTLGRSIVNRVVFTGQM